MGLGNINMVAPDVQMHSVSIYFVKLRQGSARDGEGLKASKLKPLPRAYIKVGCHHHPPEVSISGWMSQLGARLG